MTLFPVQYSTENFELISCHLLLRITIAVEAYKVLVHQILNFAIVKLMLEFRTMNNKTVAPHSHGLARAADGVVQPGMVPSASARTSNTGKKLDHIAHPWRCFSRDQLSGRIQEAPGLQRAGARPA